MSRKKFTPEPGWERDWADYDDASLAHLHGPVNDPPPKDSSSEALYNDRLTRILGDMLPAWNRLADLLPDSYVPLLDGVFEELGRTRLLLAQTRRVTQEDVKDIKFTRTRTFRNPFDPSD